MSPAEKTEILFGFHSVFEAIRAKKRRFHRLLVSGKKGTARADKIIRMAQQNRIEIDTIRPDILDKMTNQGKHQGVALEVSAFPVNKGTDIIPRIQADEAPCFILVVEHLEDPHNLGALIRTALCAGVDYIMIPKDRSVRPTPTVSRSSAGAMEHAQIFLMTNTAAILKILKKENVWVAGMDADGTSSLFESDLTGNLALVIGGEHKGIRPLVKKTCDFLLSIPMTGKVNSLNASVAGAIAMYEAHRQRIKSK
ncbi:MAG: 23S rRNA (guanosine(2251)-2'-O)-methyltransferase RlmB [Desulfobacteraceae bacterium]|nr:23S rRNA (guanosine(2251)-2'-O)-methyltransferase RlmB [Desulfobacteraceae bacterium]